jgi:hypothetical protein
MVRFAWQGERSRRNGWCQPNGLKMSRKPIRPTPTYQVATTAAIPEGMMAAYLKPQARMLVGSNFELSYPHELG